MTPFATTTDLAEYLGVTVGSLPADSTRLLLRASELVEYAMFDNYDATNADHVEAAKKATCAQVEFWSEINVSMAIMGNNLSSFKSGDLSMNFANSKNSMSSISSRATIHLGRQGLLFRGLRKMRDMSCNEVVD